MKKRRRFELFGCQSKIGMKGKFLWIFCAFVAASSAAAIPPEERENLEILGEEFYKIEPHIFENKILEAINKLKDFLKKGDPSSGTSPLDPYFLPRQDFDFFIMDTALKGYLQNTTFAHFGEFYPEEIEFKLFPLHFQLNVWLNLLKIDGRYSLLGKIFNEIPVNGTGKFTSETRNLTLSLYLRPTTLDSSIQIKDLIIEFKTLREKMSYTNELEDDKIHVLDEEFALQILDRIQAKYFPPLLNMVKEVLNHFLLGFTFSDIVKIILDFLNKK